MGLTMWTRRGAADAAQKCAGGGSTDATSFERRKPCVLRTGRLNCQGDVIWKCAQEFSKRKLALARIESPTAALGSQACSVRRCGGGIAKMNVGKEARIDPGKIARMRARTIEMQGIDEQARIGPADLVEQLPRLGERPQFDVGHQFEGNAETHLLRQFA